MTHIVKRTYQVRRGDEVVQPWTVQVRCGREWPQDKCQLGPRGDRICRTCERARDD